MKQVGASVTPQRVPPEALLLSLLSLAVPVTSSLVLPNWTNDDLGFLVWVLALIPGFLLSYHRGWRGASIGLAAAMATFSISQAVANWLGMPSPNPDLMIAAVVVLITAAFGSGWITDRLHRSLQDAQQLALTDAGTGLANRRHGMLHLERAFAAANRGRALSVVMFDLDRFKRINDEHGHDHGDAVLALFAAVLRAQTRAEHLSSRFGGEEFVSVLDNSPADHAVKFADRVRGEFTRLCEERAWGTLTASAGVAQYDQGMASPELLLAAADQALYRAKETGRDRTVVLSRSTTGQAPLQVAVHAVAGDAAGQGETVLVVDDEANVLRTIVQTLKRRGFNVIGASDPTQAIELVRSMNERIDVLITDVIMPGMSGFRMVEMLSPEHSDLRVLYISGTSVNAVEWGGVPGAVKTFLAKPFELDELVRTLRAVLDAPLPEHAALAGSGAGDPPERA